ncbi:hypothetical protein [Enterococcus sp. OL5]|uniref:hypothetical protein n=1 Tax=Enterococcus sp. OL5 TaxID=2590214 RepID=UPI00112D31BD|nr:hypothetical protein [Enterococcus sp. OL5]TPR55574.1 hypothetical protein FJU10_16350 [Enterococcus sp. OL5]
MKNEKLTNIYYSDNLNELAVKSFLSFLQGSEKSYDQNKIIDWMNQHETLFENKKVWLLTGIKKDQTFEEFQAWLLENKYDLVVDARGLAQNFFSDKKFHHNYLRAQLALKGIAVFDLYKD